MNLYPLASQSLLSVLRLSFLTLIFAFAGRSSVQADFLIDRVDRLGDGQLSIRYPSGLGALFILDHAGSPEGTYSPLLTNSGVSASGQFTLSTAFDESQGFYRIRRYSNPTAFAHNISAGTSHTVAVMRNGTLLAWGDNSNGQLGDGTYVARSAPTPIGTNSDWCAVAAGTSHTLGLKTGGTLWSWGDAGLLVNCCSLVPVQVGTDSDWSAITTSRDTYALGFSSSFGLKRDGSLWAWGDGTQGQLGGGVRAVVSEPFRVDARNDWAAVFPAPRHTLGIRTDGSLWAWGLINGHNTPVQLGTDMDWVSAAAGEDAASETDDQRLFSLALKSDGTLYSWGGNVYGQLGNGTFTPVAIPTPADPSLRWSQIVAGSTHCLAISLEDGSPWVWGGGTLGQLGDGRFRSSSVPTRLPWSGVAALSAGAFHSVMALSDGTLLSWGSDLYGQLGDARPVRFTNPTRVGAGTNWSTATAGAKFTAALDDAGRLFTWGLNADGQLGLGDDVSRDAPDPVGAPSFVLSSVSVGRNHTLAVENDGTLWAWGDNSFGKLGIPDAVMTHAPTQVGAENDWKRVVAGYDHSFAIKQNGSLWAWGQNYRGRLGLDEISATNSPTRVGSGNDWATVCTGFAHSIGLKTNGTLWALGTNDVGQLGTGSVRDGRIPLQIGSDEDWALVTAGRNFTVAIKMDGTLWAWGDNSEFQLGISGTSSTNLPALVSIAPDWVAISAGNSHCLGLRSNGALWGWGRNDENQIDASGAKVRFPRQIGSSLDWTRISGGYTHSVGVQKDHTLWFWGADSYGEAGQPRVYGPAAIGNKPVWSAPCRP